MGLLCITHFQTPEKLCHGRVKKVQHDSGAELLACSYETEALFLRPEAVFEDYAHASTEKLLRCRPLEILNRITQSVAFHAIALVADEPGYPLVGSEPNGTGVSFETPSERCLAGTGHAADDVEGRGHARRPTDRR